MGPPFREVGGPPSASGKPRYPALRCSCQESFTARPHQDQPAPLWPPWVRVTPKAVHGRKVVFPGSCVQIREPRCRKRREVRGKALMRWQDILRGSRKARTVGDSLQYLKATNLDSRVLHIFGSMLAKRGGFLLLSVAPADISQLVSQQLGTNGSAVCQQQRGIPSERRRSIDIGSASK